MKGARGPPWKYKTHYKDNKENKELMLKQTTTKQISDALSNNLLQVIKAEIYYKTSHKTNVITDSFLEDMQFFCESGCFMDRIGWHYGKDCTTGGYIIETGRMDGDSECIIIVHLRVNENASDEEIEEVLGIVIPTSIKDKGE